jgi:hypothetical protein
MTCFAENSSREVVSKSQIIFESKAQADEKAQHTFKYVSILKRSATQLSDMRCGFEFTSTMHLKQGYVKGPFCKP